jgi:hypothetical protein
MDPLNDGFSVEIVRPYTWYWSQKTNLDSFDDRNQRLEERTNIDLALLTVIQRHKKAMIVIGLYKEQKMGQVYTISTH